jgi:hypothetical protein
VSPERVSEAPEQDTSPEPSAERPVVFCEPRLVAHPSKPEVRLEQRIKVLGRDEPLKHGRVIELPCDGSDVVLAVEALVGIEPRLREEPAFRRSYLRHWPRADREALMASLERS